MPAQVWQGKHSLKTMVKKKLLFSTSLERDDEFPSKLYDIWRLRATMYPVDYAVSRAAQLSCTPTRLCSEGSF